MDDYPEKTSKERQLFLVDFSSIAVWATEEDDVERLVYGLLEGDCPEVCEVSAWRDLDEGDEESLLYEVLNERDGSPREL